MRRLLVSSTILALTAVGTIVASPGGFAAEARVSTRTTPTEFAMKGSGYGSRVQGGIIPTGSGTTAFQVIGCTNRAGIDRENHQLEETIPGLGTASEIRTTVWTRDRRGVVSSFSRNTIARVVISDNPLGTLAINGISSLSRAFHDRTGFHTSSSTTVASIVFTPTGGQPQAMELPAPGDPLEVPGVATVAVGPSSSRVNADRARVATDALDIQVVATGARTRLAHSAAEIHRGLLSGIFSGFASGSRGEALAGNVSSGRTPHLVMPCQGTDGELRTKALVGTVLDGGLLVRGLATEERADQTRRRAHGHVEASIARLSLGGGRLTARDIVGRVAVERLSSGRLNRSLEGTSLGTITVDGEPQSFPDTDVIEVPGVAKLERNVVRRFTGGLHVTALRVTLLDGTGAVFHLGEAKLRIRPSGN